MKHAFGPYLGKSTDDYVVLNPSHRHALDVVEKYVSELDNARLRGRGLTILGPTGVGKTLLASIVLNEASEREYRVEAIELAQYVDLCKDQFSLAQIVKLSDDETHLDQYIHARQHIRYISGVSKHSADWVLFDDVSREYEADTGWSKSEFFNTLRCRWNRQRPTILTTNLSMPELELRYSDGLSSLLMESSEVILIEGDDFRCRRVN
jgi:DNA replication protein DnaC